MGQCALHYDVMNGEEADPERYTGPYRMNWGFHYVPAVGRAVARFDLVHNGKKVRSQVNHRMWAVAHAHGCSSLTA